MYCVQCGREFLAQSNFCYNCGAAIPQLAESPLQRPVSTSTTVRTSNPQDLLFLQRGSTSARGFRPRFTGKGSDIFHVNGLKMILWFVSIIGFPVGLLHLYRWGCRHLQLPTGTTVTFVGRALPLYGYCVAFGVLSTLNREIDPFSEPFYSLWLAGIWFGQMFVSLRFLKWICANLSFSSGTRLEFTGGLLAWTGWNLLFVISLFTIVGWAWVLTAMTRWQARHTRSEYHQLAFHGRGIEMLWRIAASVAASILILPAPWALSWFYRWFINNVEIEAIAASVQAVAHAPLVDQRVPV
jgi:hypothetical protein